RLPGAQRTRQGVQPLRVERAQEPPEGSAQVAVVVQAGALDEAREMRVLLQVVENAVEGRFHGGPLEPTELARRAALAAFRHERDERRGAAGQDRLVERALVPEVVVQAALVLDSRLRGYLPHGNAG